MPAFPDSEVQAHDVRGWVPSPGQFAGLATILAVLGATSIWPALFSLWTMWTTDALKSIGMIIPLISLILILRAWKRLSWDASGTWWGAVLFLAAIAAVWMQQRAVLLLVVSPHWATVLPPPSLVLLAYGSGAVLLLGGTRLFRAALFPIFLLWFANPVPHAFSLVVDLPLQAASAHIARAFAMHLGQQLTPDHLRLMFTPDFGMFIAPGCNGIRGAVTMGFIALIAGYVYRFSWFINGLVVVGAILLGYLFNLLRLCLLVLYYLVALRFPSLQNKAENADYVIGAALFLFATLLLFAAVHRLRDARGPDAGDEDVFTDAVRVGWARRQRYAMFATVGAVALCGCVGLSRAAMAMHRSVAEAGSFASRFPDRFGDYTLVRTWSENLDTGAVIYEWAQYSPANGGTRITVGVTPLFNWHDPLLCHAVRGDHPVWQGQLTTMTAGDVVTNFSSAFYTDGVTQYIEASAQCSGGSCGEFATERTRLGFVYSRPDPKSLFSAAGERATPILIRAETTDMAESPDDARQRLTADLRRFLKSVRLEDLARSYRQQVPPKITGADYELESSGRVP
jgi:exosortase J